MLSILKIELYLIEKPKRFKKLFYSDFFYFFSFYNDDVLFFVLFFMDSDGE